MYLNAFDAIAGKRPDLKNQIRLVDNYFRKGGPKGTFDSVDISHSTGLDRDTVEIILELLLTENAMKANREVICSSCNASSDESAALAMDLDGESVDCPACGQRIRKPFRVRTVYRLTSGAGEARTSRIPALVVDGLYRVCGTGSAQRAGDIVFVHGLGADHRTTWSNNASDDHDYGWLRWLGEDLGNWDVLALDYDTGKTLLSGDAGSHALYDVARQCLAKLDVSLSESKPIIFVTHSMGGLLAKRMLRIGKSSSNAHSLLADRVRAIAFIATPHIGSSVASGKLANSPFRLIYRLAKRLRSEQTKELEFEDSHLFELNNWFLDHLRSNPSSLQIRCFSEGLPESLVGEVIVSEASADAGLAGNSLVPCTDKTHTTIAKPVSRSDLVYLSIKLLVFAVVEECGIEQP